MKVVRIKQKMQRNKVILVSIQFIITDLHSSIPRARSGFVGLSLQNILHSLKAVVEENLL